MSAALAFFGWCVWVAVGAYMAIGGFFLAFVGSAFGGRAPRPAVIFGLIGCALLVGAFSQAPFHVAWGHA